MVKRTWQVRAGIAFVVIVGAAVLLAQACGGGSAAEDVTPTGDECAELHRGQPDTRPTPACPPGMEASEGQ